MQNDSILILIVICSFVVFVVMFLDRTFLKYGKFIDPCDEKIKILEAKIRQEYDEKFRELEKNYNARTNELNNKINFLLEKLVEAQQKKTVRDVQKPVKVLLACGGVHRFCSTDARMLRRASIDFMTLTNADDISIGQEVRRAYQDSSPYLGVHISAHSNGETIEMNGKNITSEELEIALIGVEIVFLSACQSHAIADKIISSGRSVVTMLFDISDELAEAFAYSFWRGINVGETAESAFKSAKSENPQIADLVGFRKQ